MDPLSPEIRDALRARRRHAAEAPSILPHLHRRIRVAQLERVSWRERLAAGISHLFFLRSAALAGGLAVLALTLSLVLVRPGARELAAAPEGPRYSLNEVGAKPASLDQRIDAVIAGAGAGSSDAHYVLTSTPVSYDSVVAF